MTEEAKEEHEKLLKESKPEEIKAHSDIVKMFEFVNEFKEEQSIDDLTLDIEALLKN